MKALVTGGAGFIGSHLCEALLEMGIEVLSVDYRKDLGNIESIDSKNFEHHVFDVNDKDDLIAVSKNCDLLFHLASNSDIHASESNTSVDFKNTLQSTWSVMEAARVNGIKKVYFSSTSAVYGDNPDVCFSESMGDIHPISYYGACKLASESIISSYAHMNRMDALIFRASNVVGPRLTHGVILDFMKKLEKDPKNLEILGNGLQTKEYVHIDDLIKGVCDFMFRIEQRVNVFNISTESSINVNFIADTVCSYLGLDDVKYHYTSEPFGWNGDIPKFRLDISKARSNGWIFKYDSSDAVKNTVEHYAKGSSRDYKQA